MNIKVWNDKYIIKSDPRQYILCEVNDKDTESAIAYLDSMHNVFKTIVEREARSNKCTTMDGYIKHIEKVNAELEKMLLKIEALIGKKSTLERIMFALPEEVSKENIGENKKKGGKKK